MLGYTSSSFLHRGSWVVQKNHRRVAITQLGLYVLEMSLPPSALVHWSSDSVWRKEELAAVTKLPSATELSVNAWFDAYGILNEHPASEISAQPYKDEVGLRHSAKDTEVFLERHILARLLSSASLMATLSTPPQKRKRRGMSQIHIPHMQPISYPI